MFAQAPIVLFTYNRPQHTQLVLDSLSANAESKESILYIYCDGPREHADNKTIEKINETRRIVKAERRFKEVLITEQPRNKGLANSIIDGVTEVINKHNSVIVLEDDLVLSPFFLSYMNDSLKRYENNKNVGQIGACNFFACGDRFPVSFFVPIPDCWGWATWKNRWDRFIKDPQQLLKELQEKELIHKFNVYGSYDMEGMLKMQIEGKVNSWAIRWQAVCILNQWLILYPNPSVSNHIESAEATHANVNITPPLCSKALPLETVDTIEITSVINAMTRGYGGNTDYYGKFKKGYLKRRIKRAIRSLISFK